LSTTYAVRSRGLKGFTAWQDFLGPWVIRAIWPARPAAKLPIQQMARHACPAKPKALPEKAFGAACNFSCAQSELGYYGM